MNTPQIILKNVDCLDHLKQMVSDGITLLNSTIATQEYHDEFMAFQFVQTNGMTNEQLWELFCKAPIEVSIKLWDMGFIRDHFQHTIGYEDPNFPNMVFVNSFFVGTPYMVADNVAHEVWHILGLHHNHPTDYTSVPYAQNTIFANTIEKLQGKA